MSSGKTNTKIIDTDRNLHWVRDASIDGTSSVSPYKAVNSAGTHFRIDAAALREFPLCFHFVTFTGIYCIGKSGNPGCPEQTTSNDDVAKSFATAMFNNQSNGTESLASLLRNIETSISNAYCFHTL